MYPLADFSLRPTLGALIHIPSGRKNPHLIEKLLVDVPFGRFLADFSLRHIWSILAMYPLAENLLADVPFGRFSLRPIRVPLVMYLLAESSPCQWTLLQYFPWRCTLRPIFRFVPLGCRYLSTFWPNRRHFCRKCTHIRFWRIGTTWKTSIR